MYIRIWGSEAQLRRHNRQRTYAVSLAGVITSIHATVQQPAGAPRRGRGAGGMLAPSAPRLGPLMTPDFQDSGRAPIKGTCQRQGHVHGMPAFTGRPRRAQQPTAEEAGRVLPGHPPGEGPCAHPAAGAFWDGAYYSSKFRGHAPPVRLRHLRALSRVPRPVGRH